MLFACSAKQSHALQKLQDWLLNNPEYAALGEAVQNDPYAADMEEKVVEMFTKAAEQNPHDVDVLVYFCLFLMCVHQYFPTFAVFGLPRHTVIIRCVA